MTNLSPVLESNPLHWEKCYLSRGLPHLYTYGVSFSFKCATVEKILTNDKIYLYYEINQIINNNNI